MGDFATMLDLSEQSVLVLFSLFRISFFRFFLPTNYFFSLALDTQ